MCSLPSPAVSPQREQRPVARLAVVARSETVRRGQVVPVYGESAWVRRPTPRPNGWAGAVLVIGGTAYAAESFHLGLGDGGPYCQVVDLRKADGTHYRLTFGPGGDHCDCAHHVFRGVVCKHLATVRASLDWLEAAERDEWADALDAQLPDPADIPF